MPLQRLNAVKTRVGHTPLWAVGDLETLSALTADETVLIGKDWQ
jgi:hypothetical protein